MTMNWNKYQSKVSVKKQNQYLDYLFDPSFQRVIVLIVTSFEDTLQLVGGDDYTTGYLLNYPLFQKIL